MPPLSAIITQPFVTSAYVIMWILYIVAKLISLARQVRSSLWTSPSNLTLHLGVGEDQISI